MSIKSVHCTPYTVLYVNYDSSWEEKENTQIELKIESKAIDLEVPFSGYTSKLASKVKENSKIIRVN